MRHCKPVIYPTNIWIEPTNMCNLRCIFCFHSNNSMTRCKGMMTFEMFRKIIDDVKSFKPRVILHHSGESFLNKELFNFISYAKREKLKVDLTTNGTILDNCDILCTGIDNLNISLAGVDAIDCNETRGRHYFESVKKNIMDLAAKKHKEAIATRISVNVVVTRRNKNQINEFKKEFGSINGIDYCFGRKLMDWSGSVDVSGLLPDAKIIKKSKRFIKQLLAQIGIYRLCDSVYSSAGILWDGTIVPCCVDFNGALSLGNIADGPFLKTWNGDNMQKLRSMLKSPTLTKKHSVCGHCCLGK